MPNIYETNVYPNMFPVALKYVRTHTPYKDKRGLSLRQLSSLTKVSPTYLSQLENNTRNPTRELIAKISEGLSSITKLDFSDYQSFFVSMTGELKPDAKIGLKISNTLTDTYYGDFLQLIMGYMGMVVTRENVSEEENITLAEDANKNWDYEELASLRSVEAHSSKYHLNEISEDLNKNNDIVIDNKLLDRNEKIILNGAVETIRKIRNNNKSNHQVTTK